LGEIDIGLGTDTGGSIRVPASYNGLFGIRTSHSALSTEHMVPLAPLFDTVGWMTRDAALLEAVGQVLLPETGEHFPAGPLNIGVLKPVINDCELWTPAHQNWLNQQPGLSEVKNLALDTDWLARASQCFRVLQGYAIWQTHGAWITQRKPTFASDIHMRFSWCSQITPQQAREADIERIALQVEIADWFTDVDLLVLPTTPGPAPLLGAGAAWMDKYRSQLMGLTAPAGLAGLPQIHLPVFSVDGAAAGVSLLGKRGMDRPLLTLATLLDKGATQRIVQVAP
jgi:aspartyl-tRNA(Asn)/glutamyl-tRNA(Gln) amidotransferase subunit A